MIFGSLVYQGSIFQQAGCSSDRGQPSHNPTITYVSILFTSLQKAFFLDMRVATAFISALYFNVSQSIVTHPNVETCGAHTNQTCFSGPMI